MQREMQTALSRVQNQVTNTISYDNNCYAKHASSMKSTLSEATTINIKKTKTSRVKLKEVFHFWMNLHWKEKFGLVWFYGTSTIVGYSVTNPVISYILDIYDL